MIEEILFRYGTVINIAGFIITASALYWKMKMDLKELDLKIVEIQCDRKDKWDKYYEDRDKHEACLDEIMKAISEIRGDVKSIKTDLTWLKNGSFNNGYKNNGQ